MTKLFSYLAVFCLMTVIIADDCSNPLLTTFGFTSLGTPQNVTGLKYCKTLQSSLSCCSADTINSFQDKAEALSKKLSDIVAARDKAIVETRDQIIPGLQNSINQLKDNSQKAFTKIIGQMGGSLGNMSMNMSGMNMSGMPFSSDMTTAIAGAMQNMTDMITGNLSTIKNGFKDFQKERSPCIVELIKLQASSWCLACDPAWATKGVSNDNVSMSDRVCQRVQGACFEFVSGAAQQGAVLAMKTVGPLVSQMATAMGQIANQGLQGVSGLESLATSLDANTNTYNASNSTMQPVEMPPACTQGNCNWICNSMFINGQLDPNAVTAGGIQSNASNDVFSDMGSGSGRLLIEEDDQQVVRRKLLEKRGRVLAANEWNPDSDEAGVTVTFSDDPAGVSNTGAGLIKAGIISMVTMLFVFVF